MITDASLKAHSYLNDEFFKDVVQKQRELYINNILNSSDDDVDLRERTRLKLRGLEEFIASLQSIAADREIKESRWKFF